MSGYGMLALYNDTRTSSLHDKYKYKISVDMCNDGCIMNGIIAAPFITYSWLILIHFIQYMGNCTAALRPACVLYDEGPHYSHHLEPVRPQLITMCMVKHYCVYGIHTCQCKFMLFFTVKHYYAIRYTYICKCTFMMLFFTRSR